MSDSNQIVIPPSFIAVYVPPGRIKPTLHHAALIERYEWCEDLATLLTERATALQFDLGITEHDVLERSLAGLLGEDARVSADEAQWVVRRLAELLGWQPLEAGPSEQGPAG